MIPAKYSDKERVVSILASSFADNPSINYAVRQDAKKQQFATTLYLLRYTQ